MIMSRYRTVRYGTVQLYKIIRDTVPVQLYRTFLFFFIFLFFFFKKKVYPAQYRTVLYITERKELFIRDRELDLHVRTGTDTVMYVPVTFTQKNREYNFFFPLSLCFIS